MRRGLFVCLEAHYCEGFRDVDNAVLVVDW